MEEDRAEEQEDADVHRGGVALDEGRTTRRSEDVQVVGSVDSNARIMGRRPRSRFSEW